MLEAAQGQLAPGDFGPWIRTSTSGPSGDGNGRRDHGAGHLREARSIRHPEVIVHLDDARFMKIILLPDSSREEPHFAVAG